MNCNYGIHSAHPHCFCKPTNPVLSDSSKPDTMPAHSAKPGSPTFGSRAQAWRRVRVFRDKGCKHARAPAPALSEENLKALAVTDSSPQPQRRPEKISDYFNSSSTSRRSSVSTASFSAPSSCDEFAEERNRQCSRDSYCSTSSTSSTKSISFFEQVACILIPTRHELGQESDLWWTPDELRQMRYRFCTDERLRQHGADRAKPLKMLGSNNTTCDPADVESSQQHKSSLSWDDRSA